MIYINGKNGNQTETIDQFETRKEAREMLKEYQLAYQGQGYSLWLSQRACKDWRDK